MSTLQNTTQHRDRIRTRPGTALALAGLIAIGLALLIVIPTGRHTSAPAARATYEAALTAQTPAPAGCSRDPVTHALNCYRAAKAPIARPAPGDYFRDPATHKLLRVPTGPHRAGQLPANQSRGRIVP